MLRYNCCPRCQGNVRVDRDEYGWYEECLMCGYMHDVEGSFGTGEHNTRPEKDKTEVKIAA